MKNPRIQKFINDITKRDVKNEIAVFDFDNTCILGDIGDAVFNYAVINNLIDYKLLFACDDFWNFKDGDEKRMMLETLSFSQANLDKLKEEFLALYWDLVANNERKLAYSLSAMSYGGMNVDDLKSLSIKVFKEELNSKFSKYNFGRYEFHKGIEVNQKVLELIKILKSHFVDVYIVSATNKFIIEAVAQEFFGIDSEKIIGITPKVFDCKIFPSIDVDENPITFMEGKVDAIKKKLGRAPILAIGDSIGDLAMLKYAKEIGIILHKGDNFYKKIISDSELENSSLVVEER